MRKKIIILVLIVFSAILIRFLFGVIGTNLQKNARKAAMVPPVTVSVVEIANQRKTYEIPARVTAKQQIQVNARINGYLTHAYFNEGDYVKAGDVLFEIEPQEYILAAERAKAEIIRVKAQQNYYDKQARRAQELVQKNYIARAEYDNAIAQRDAFRAQTAYAEMAYRDALRNLSYTKVKAPVSGRISNIKVSIGNYVSLNSGALTTIYSTKPMFVYFPLDMNQYNTLNEIDDSANVTRTVEYVYSDGRKYAKTGIQNFRDNMVDESTGTMRMRATFDNDDDGLIPGDFGKIIIYSNKDAKIPMIPVKCVQENQMGKYVFRLDNNNIPEMVYIKELAHEGDRVLVSEGLNIGDRIITTGILKVIQGLPVKIVQEEVIDDPQPKDNIFKRIFRKLFRRGNK